MKPYQNLMQKYNITEEQIDTAVNEICKHGLANSCCDTYWLCAVVELMCNGDIGEDNAANN